MKRLNSGFEIAEKFRENREEVIDIFRESDSVVLAYVFGSVAKEEEGELSDIDFGVFLVESLEREDYLEKELELRKELSRVLGERMDLVVMNEASHLMNYNIISEGELLYQKLKDKKMEIEAGIMMEYLDRRFYDERHVEERLKGFAERGLA